MSKLEEKLAVNKYYVDDKVHITVNQNVCDVCDKRVCVHICPAGCFKLVANRLSYAYEQCLECGSCRLVCKKGAINWTYPRGGFGICYEFG